MHGIDVTEHYLIKEGKDTHEPLDFYDYSEKYLTLEDEELLLTMNEQSQQQRMGSSDWE